MSKIALDASALLAALFNEKGSEIVQQHLSEACISSVNLSEVASKLSEMGLPEEEIKASLQSLSITTVDFTTEQAFIAASLTKPSKKLGLSLGDRACLSLGLHKNIPVITADTAWKKLNLAIEIQLIR